ncbi:MAG: trypsin-like peptidase domain-containing protein [Chloroflexi bacterium]|nr:trypsin-like peptidase domain-containing protein [Chloroflexota bacterium]
MTTPKRGPNTRTWIIGGLILVAGTLGFAGALSLVSGMQQGGPDAQPTLLTDTAEVVVQPVGSVVEDRYAVGYGDSPREVVITKAGATYIQPFLEQVDIAPGDTVVVSSPDGVQRYTYDASSAGQWTFPIDGETAVVTLISLSGDHPDRAGVTIPRLGQGFTVTEFAQSICGSNDIVDVACSASSHPIEYGLRQPVARLFYTNGGGQYVCTTWRVTPDNFMLTNQHCIPNQTVMNTAIIRFNFQAAGCGASSIEPYVEVRGGTLIYVNTTYDVALYSLREADFPLVQQFGYLELDTSAPTANETIFIPQHPAGLPKKFGLNSTSDGGRCRVIVPSTAGYAANSDLAYTCDTQGGSSGSPVIALDTLRVVGLHHLGAGRPDGSQCGPSPYYNQAVRIDQIWPLLAPYFPQPIAPMSTASPTATEAPTLTPSATFTPTQTFTPSNTPTPTNTPTVTYTPTSTPERVARDLLVDGGFELESDAWVLIDGTGGDARRERKQRSGGWAFQFKGGAGDDVKLVQSVDVSGIMPAAGDVMEFVAHIDTRRIPDGFAMARITYADGVRQKSKIRFEGADHYEPRAAEIFLRPVPLSGLEVKFRHKSQDNAKVWIDDVRLEWISPTP